MISVVIPTYRHANYILHTLDSVFAQTCQDFEVIVVNDGSPDNTAEILRPLVESGRIRYIEQPNGGQASARNRGLAAAQGEYIAYLDDDDLWPPDKLQWQVEELRNSEAVMVYGDHVEFYPDGRHTGHRLIGKPTGRVHEQFLLRNWLTSLGQALIRTESLRSIAGFDPAIWGSDDWDMLIRLSRSGEFIHRPRVALRYRIHDGNASRSAILHARNHFKVMRKHMGVNLPLMAAHMREASRYFVPKLMDLCRTSRSDGRYGESLCAQMYALAFRPSLVMERRFLYPLVGNLARRRPRSR